MRHPLPVQREIVVQIEAQAHRPLDETRDAGMPRDGVVSFTDTATEVVFSEMPQAPATILHSIQKQLRRPTRERILARSELTERVVKDGSMLDEVQMRLGDEIESPPFGGMRVTCLFPEPRVDGQNPDRLMWSCKSKELIWRRCVEAA